MDPKNKSTLNGNTVCKTNNSTNFVDYILNNDNVLTEVLLNEKATSVKLGTRVSDLLLTELPCGGHGKCGKCKVIAKGMLSPLTDDEKKHLTEKEIQDGVRLACHTYILGDCSIKKTPDNSDASVLTDGKKHSFELLPTFNRFGVAIDIGTTTIAASLVDKNGFTLAKHGVNNPQSVFGADVISRIESAISGNNEELRTLITKSIDGVILELCCKANISSSEIDGIAITGNTVMLYLLTNTSPKPLSHAPFTLTRRFNETLSASELGLAAPSPDTSVYLPPCISAFIGADTVCAILSSGMLSDPSSRPYVLADIGTNGEMALSCGSGLYVCSTAAGPAFEGVGISRGMRGEAGAIDKVTLINGQLHASVIGGGEPKGICGSGLVDAVAALLDLEELDETGYLEDDEVTVLSPVTLTAKDIRAVQLAKSAINAGIGTLLNVSGVCQDDIFALYVAGGFGNYLNMTSATRIGLLPEKLAKKTVNLGNAALSGAEMLLLNSDARLFAEDFSRRATVVELSTSKYFSDAFISGMLF